MEKTLFESSIDLITKSSTLYRNEQNNQWLEEFQAQLSCYIEGEPDLETCYKTLKLLEIELYKEKSVEKTSTSFLVEHFIHLLNIEIKICEFKLYETIYYKKKIT